jgi:hypothetical protein
MVLRALHACFRMLGALSSGARGCAHALQAHLMLTAALPMATLGCGPVTYTLEVDKAERVVEAARAENAAYYAPYELQFAEAHLDQAHEQAAQAEYEDAILAVRVAQTYGLRALTRSAQPGRLDR